MKQNRLTTLLAAGAVSAIALTTGFAQESTTTTTTKTDPDTSTSSTSTKTIEASGTIMAYKPGLDFITVKTETSTAPIMYYYTKSTTIVDPKGKTVEWSALKPDVPVKYTYVNDGDRMVISKITLTKPALSHEKTKTTTTTTKP